MKILAILIIFSFTISSYAANSLKRKDVTHSVKYLTHSSGTKAATDVFQPTYLEEVISRIDKLMEGKKIEIHPMYNLSYHKLGKTTLEVIIAKRAGSVGSPQVSEALMKTMQKHLEEITSKLDMKNFEVVFQLHD